MSAKLKSQPEVSSKLVSPATPEPTKQSSGREFLAEKVMSAVLSDEARSEYMRILDNVFVFHPGLREKKGEGMKNITKGARQRVLQQLRKAVCLQTSLWDECSSFDDAVARTSDYESDLVTRVAQVTSDYVGKELGESDLDEILPGIEELNKETRHTLLNALQDVIRLQSELWIAASILAETLNCELEEVLNRLNPLSITADTGMELGERDLDEFLG